MHAHNIKTILKAQDKSPLLTIDRPSDNNNNVNTLSFK